MSRILFFWVLVFFAQSIRSAPLSFDLAVAGPLQKESIRVEAFMDVSPQRGFMPLRVFVRNTGDTPGLWRFRFTSKGGYSDSRQMRSEFVLAVDSGGEKNVEWMVPVYPSLKNPERQTNLAVRVEGPDGVVVNQYRLTEDHTYGSGGLSLVGLSESVALVHREALQLELNNQRGSANFNLARVDLAMIPEDSRGLIGLDVLVMSQAEWTVLPLGHRYALRQWLAQGGQMLLSDRQGPIEKVGLGAIHSFSFAQKSPEDIYQKLSRLPTLTTRLTADPSPYVRNRWSLRDKLPEISRPIGLLTLFVLAIAFLLGPANLFLAHRRKQPARVLWTTPLLSAVLSLLLIAVILLSDGFGGRGNRSLAVLLLPADQVEVLVQEQVSRSGVLIGDRFDIPTGVVMTSIDTEVSVNPRAGSDGEMQERFTMDPGGSTDGDWFKSRRIQGHVLQQVRPSRAQILWVPGKPPQVSSTVDAVLTHLVFRDANGEYWTLDSLAAGERKILSPLSPNQAKVMIDALSTREDDVFDHHARIGGEKRWFYARSTEGSAPFVDTLDSIRWQEQSVAWYGPLAEGVTP